MIVETFPRAVRRDAAYMGVSAAVFVIPTIVLGVIVYFSPSLILSLMGLERAADFDQMYSPAARAMRPASSFSTRAWRSAQCDS